MNRILFTRHGAVLLGSLLLVTALLAITACKETETRTSVQSDIRIDTVPCLGRATGCRGGLTASTNQGAGNGNACLVVDNGPESQIHTRRLSWIQDELSPIERAPFTFAPGANVRAAVFILEQGNAQDPCQALTTTSDCEAAVCLVR